VRWVRWVSARPLLRPSYIGPLHSETVAIHFVLCPCLGWYLVIPKKSKGIVISLLPGIIRRLAAQCPRPQNLIACPVKTSGKYILYQPCDRKCIHESWFHGAARCKSNPRVNSVIIGASPTHRALPNDETHNLITFSSNESRLLAQLLRDSFPISSYSSTPSFYHTAYAPFRYILPRYQSLQANSSVHFISILMFYI
jgi:hypothetical protein